MTAAETEAYVQSELGACGRDESLFSDGALRQAIDLSGGVVRIVNRVCREALVRAEQEAAGRITARHFGPGPLSGDSDAPLDVPPGGPGSKADVELVSNPSRRRVPARSPRVGGLRSAPSTGSSTRTWSIGTWAIVAGLGLIVAVGVGWTVATLPTDRSNTMAGASEQPLALPDPPGRAHRGAGNGVPANGNLDSGETLVQQVEALRELARTQREQGDLEGAVGSIAQALVLSAGDPQLRPIQTGLLAEQQRDDNRLREVETLRVEAARRRQERDLTGALQAVNQALELNPASHRMLGLRAGIESELETIWAKEREVSALRDKATAEHAAGNLDAAIDALEAAVAVTPRNGELVGLREDWVAERARRLAEYLQAADAAGAAGEFDQAIEQIDQALALAPDDPALIERRAELLAARSAAIERGRRIAALRGQAESAYSDGDLDRAIGLLDEAMIPDTQAPELDTLRNAWVAERDAALALSRRVADILQTALAAADRGDFDLALARASAALELAPGDPELISVQAELRATRDEAMRLVADVAALRAAAVDARSDGDYELAMERVAEAMSLQPTDESLRALSAELERDRLELVRRQEEVARLRATAEHQRATGDLDGAIVSLQTALAIPGADIEVQSLYAEVNAAYAARRDQALELERIEAKVNRLRDAGDVDGAIRELENALRTLGDSVHLRGLLTELGTTSSQDRNRHAAEHGREFVERGDALLKLGDVASARLFYREAIDAGNERAAMCLAVTYDPTSLQALGIQGVFTDRALAETLYRQAIAAGETEAGERLTRLLQQGDVAVDLQ